MFVGVFLIHCFSMFYLFYAAKMIHKSPNRCETRAATLTLQGCLSTPAASLCSPVNTLKPFFAVWQHCFDKHWQRLVQPWQHNTITAEWQHLLST